MKNSYFSNKSALLLSFRVIIGFLVICTLGEYLSVTYTRVFVRSDCFLVSTILLSINTILFFYGLGLRNKIALFIFTIYSLSLSYTFLWLSLSRYNGGINTTYEELFYLTFYAMVANGIIWIISFLEVAISKTLKNNENLIN